MASGLQRKQLFTDDKHTYLPRVNIHGKSIKPQSKNFVSTEYDVTEQVHHLTDQSNLFLNNWKNYILHPLKLYVHKLSL